MGIRLSEEAAGRLVRARQNRQMTQTELAQAARISLRTIQLMETRKRTSFTESTLVHLCRTLGITLDELIGTPASLPPTEVQVQNKTSENTPTELEPDPESRNASDSITTSLKQTDSIQTKNHSLKWWVFLGIVALVVLAAGYYWNETGYNKWRQNGRVSRDWVTYPAASISSLTPDRQAWQSIWAKQASGVEFNRFEFRRAAVIQDTLEGIIQWSHHYFGVKPNIYVNLFCEWEPKLEYHLFDGGVSGDSSIACRFRLRCPEKPGLYRVRAFYGLAAAPVTNFLGSEDMCDKYTDGCPKYIEAQVLVFPKNYKRKLKESVSESKSGSLRLGN